MSFWDNVKKFAQPYADDDYDDYDEDEEYLDDYDAPAEPVRRGPARRTGPAPAPAPMMDDDLDDDDDFGFGGVAAPAAPSYNAPVASGYSAPVASGYSAPAAPVSGGFNGHVVNMSTGMKQEVVLFRPVNFGDTTKAADNLRSNKAVVLNLENVDKAMSRRVVDFLSGCVYALNGSVKKIAQSAYLFCPHNMDVVGDLEALQAEVESYI